MLPKLKNHPRNGTVGCRQVWAGSACHLGTLWVSYVEYYSLICVFTTIRVALDTWAETAPVGSSGAITGILVNDPQVTGCWEAVGPSLCPPLAPWTLWVWLGLRYPVASGEGAHRRLSGEGPRGGVLGSQAMGGLL